MNTFNPNDLMAAMAASSLDPQMEKYCLSRAGGMGIRAAMVAAGIERKLATVQAWENPRSRLYREEVALRIKEYLSLIREIAVRRTGVTTEWVLMSLKNIVDRCLSREGEPIMVKVKGEWKESGKYHRMDARNGAAALELLGRHLGIFNDKSKNTDPFALYSEEELKRYIEELCRRLDVNEGVAVLKPPPSRK